MGDANDNGRRILVVEDEPAISQLCLRVLTSEGFAVDIAANRLVAQDILNKKEYDLYFIDIRTPVMNGKELYKYIEKEHPELASKVIFTTGDLLDTELKSFFEKTNRPCLPKPFTPDELRAIVRQALE